MERRPVIRFRFRFRLVPADYGAFLSKAIFAQPSPGVWVGTYTCFRRGGWWCTARILD